MSLSYYQKRDALNFNYESYLPMLRENLRNCTPQLRKIVLALINVIKNKTDYKPEALNKCRTELLALQDKWNWKMPNERNRQKIYEPKVTRNLDLDDGPEEISNCPDVIQPKSTFFYIRPHKVEPKPRERPKPEVKQEDFVMSVPFKRDYGSNECNEKVILPSKSSMDQVKPEDIHELIRKDLQREMSPEISPVIEISSQSSQNQPQNDKYVKDPRLNIPSTSVAGSKLNPYLENLGPRVNAALRDPRLQSQATSRPIVRNVEPNIDVEQRKKSYMDKFNVTIRKKVPETVNERMPDPRLSRKSPNAEIVFNNERNQLENENIESALEHSQSSVPSRSIPTDPSPTHPSSNSTETLNSNVDLNRQINCDPRISTEKSHRLDNVNKESHKKSHLKEPNKDILHKNASRDPRLSHKIPDKSVSSNRNNDRERKIEAHNDKISKKQIENKMHDKTRDDGDRKRNEKAKEISVNSKSTKIRDKSRDRSNSRPLIKKIDEKQHEVQNSVEDPQEDPKNSESDVTESATPSIEDENHASKSDSSSNDANPSPEVANPNSNSIVTEKSDSNDDESDDESDSNDEQNTLVVTLEVAREQRYRGEPKRKQRKARGQGQRRSKRLKTIENQIKTEPEPEEQPEPVAIVTAADSNVSSRTSENTEPQSSSNEIDIEIPQNTPIDEIKQEGLECELPILNMPVNDAAIEEEPDNFSALIKSEPIFETTFSQECIETIQKIVKKENSIEIEELSIDIKPSLSQDEPIPQEPKPKRIRKIKEELIELSSSEIESSRNNIENMSFINHRVSFFFSCNICGFSTIEKEIFTDHLNSHNGLQWTGFCSICDAYILSEDTDLIKEYEHMLKVHVKQRDVINLDEDKEVTAVRPIFKQPKTNLEIEKVEKKN
uniref:CSON014393 protein n=1 Tax=Culicoides sonorensis TaxID=179676 RepID=A0A336MAF3_CULSO